MLSAELVAAPHEPVVDRLAVDAAALGRDGVVVACCDGCDEDLLELRREVGATAAARVVDDPVFNGQSALGVPVALVVLFRVLRLALPLLRLSRMHFVGLARLVGRLAFRVLLLLALLVLELGVLRLGPARGRELLGWTPSPRGRGGRLIAQSVEPLLASHLDWEVYVGMKPRMPGRVGEVSSVAGGRKHFADGKELCRYVRAQYGPVALLSFSLGKDSIAAWLQMREHFPRIVPYFLYMVPGLGFVERGLEYFESVFGCRIYRLPHPSLYRLLNNLVFQAPENCAIVERMRLRLFEYEEISGFVRRDAKCETAFAAQGVRSADSPMRMLAIKKHGPINYRRQTFYPVFDWHKADVISAIERAGVKLPYDYTMFGRTFDGLDYRFISVLKEHLPEDYERVLRFFPLAELELLRRQWAAERDANGGRPVMPPEREKA